MRHIRHHLKKCRLFSDMDDRQIHQVLQGLHYRVSAFSREQMVASEGATCMHLGIIMTGEVSIQRIYQSGRTLTVDRLRAGDIFGEVIIFSGHRRYPATITAADDTRIMFIDRDEVVKLCYSHPRFLDNFLGMLSEKILTLNRRVKFLSQPTIRSKVISYLLHEAQQQETPELQLAGSRGDLASELGIPRPSLSRELGKMKKEGLIDFDRHWVLILDLEAMEQSQKE